MLTEKQFLEKIQEELDAIEGQRNSDDAAIVGIKCLIQGRLDTLPEEKE